MRHYLIAGKNIGISILAGVVVGAGSAELSDYIAHNEWVTSITSTVADIAASYSTLFYLNWQDHKDAYGSEKGKILWKKVLADNVKIGSICIAFDFAYLVGRPFLTKEFLEHINPSSASLISDAICYPLELAVEIPLYRRIFKANETQKKGSRLEAKIRSLFSKKNKNQPM